MRFFQSNPDKATSIRAVNNKSIRYQMPFEPPLMGRDQELGQVGSKLHKVISGSGRLVAYLMRQGLVRQASH